MKTYLIADTHFNHANIATYCQRPANFTEIILRNLRNTLTPEDTLIHLGDVYIGKKPPWLCEWPGKKILIRGNHDRGSGWASWQMRGFDFVCDGLKFRNCWLTHEPSTSLADGCELNIHGHLHNIWDGFAPEGPSALKIDRLKRDWQRLFAIEYTNYMPIEFEKFINHPDKFRARHP